MDLPGLLFVGFIMIFTNDRAFYLTLHQGQCQWTARAHILIHRFQYCYDCGVLRELLQWSKLYLCRPRIRVAVL